jgi:hypothetical protein
MNICEENTHYACRKFPTSNEQEFSYACVSIGDTSPYIAEGRHDHPSICFGQESETREIQRAVDLIIPMEHSALFI